MMSQPELPLAAEEGLAASIGRVQRACQDAERAYAWAAGAVADTSLKPDLVAHAERRRAYALALGNAFANLGGADAAGALLAPSTPWREITEGGSDAPIVAACLRADDRALACYAEALEELAGHRLRALIAEEAAAYARAQDEARELHARSRAAHASC